MTIVWLWIFYLGKSLVPYQYTCWFPMFCHFDFPTLYDMCILHAIQWAVGRSFQYCRAMIMGIVDMYSKCLITQIWPREDCCPLSVEIAPLSWIQNVWSIHNWSWAWKACIYILLMIYEQVGQLVWGYTSKKDQKCENSSLENLLCIPGPCRKPDVVTWCRYPIYT